MSYLSRTITPADGVTTVFPVSFPYTQQADVLVYSYLNGATNIGVPLVAGVDYDWTSPGTIVFRAGHVPAGGNLVDARRSTKKDALAELLQSGGSLRTDDLMDNYQQLFFLAQEALDAENDLQLQAPAIRSIIAGALVAGPNIIINQALDGTLTLSAPLVAYTDEMAQDTVASMLQAGAGISLSYSDLTNTLTVANTVAAYTDEQVRDVMGVCLRAGANVTLTVNDAGDSITIDAAGGAGGTDPEVVRDTMATALVAGAGIGIVVDDPGNTITINSSVTQYTDEMARDALGAALVAGTGLGLVVNDAGDTITFSCSITQYTDEMARDAIGAALRVLGGLVLTVNDAGDTITLDSSVHGPKFLGPATSSTDVTLSDTDANTIRKLTGGTGRTITADASLSAGFSCVIWNLGTVAMTLSCPTGVYKNGATTSFTTGTLAPGAQVTLIHYGSGVYIASGNGLT